MSGQPFVPTLLLEMGRHLLATVDRDSIRRPSATRKGRSADQLHRTAENGEQKTEDCSARISRKQAVAKSERTIADLRRPTRTRSGKQAAEVRNQMGESRRFWVPGARQRIYFGVLTSPDNSSSTFTIGFTLNRKLLGSLIPHFTYGTSNLAVPFQ